MLSENSTALKEWAAVCLALADGRQSLLIRKGGIAEGPGGFRLDRDEFWLYPTQFHQSADQLADGTQELLQRVAAAGPLQGRLLIETYAVVKEVAFVSEESGLDALAGRHVLSPEVVRQRFHYRRPGLFVAAVDVFRLPRPTELPDQPAYAGCHSWVELDHPLATAELTPVSRPETLVETVKLVQSLALAAGKATGENA
ncbi:MAG TPA: DUF1802 family protein [Caulifigura sp.]|jgi:hypothetical protein|nr:DUF1802 family protein [Caulifigura sp.]